MVDPPGAGTRLSAAGLRVALAVEDAWQAALVGLLGLLGRHRVTVLPFVGHGSPDRVHVRARVVLGSRALPAPQAEPCRRPGPAGGTAAVSVADAAQLARPLPHRRAAALPVTVEHPGGGRTTTRGRPGGLRRRGARRGRPALRAGSELTLTVSWRGHTAEVLARSSWSPGQPVRAGQRRGRHGDRDRGDPRAGVAPADPAHRGHRAGAAARRRRALPRAGRGPAAAGPSSTCPPARGTCTTCWREFIALRGFPRGPLLLTDWGPGRAGFLRVAAEEHKRALIRQVLEDHPGLGVVLVGDTGQLDPEIYAAVAAEAPDRVRRSTCGGPPASAPPALPRWRLAARVTATGGADAGRRRQRAASPSTRGRARAARPADMTAVEAR